VAITGVVTDTSVVVIMVVVVVTDGFVAVVIEVDDGEAGRLIVIVNPELENISIVARVLCVT
jgi:hypothetical protein